GYEATALRIEGAANGDFATTITGGMLNTNAISAQANEANATAISLGSGAVLGTLDNSGDITASVSSLLDFSATAVLLEDGGELSALTNSGVIRASTFGEAANAYAIRDLSGSLTDITNTGLISAFHSSDGTEVTDFGVTRAVDLSSSTQDITFLQTLATPTNDVNGDDVIDNNDVIAPTLVGDIIFGSGNDTLTSTSGTITGSVEFGLGDADMELSATAFEGDVSFADGDNTLSLLSSTFVGDLVFGGDRVDADFTNAVFDGQLFSDSGLNQITAVDTDFLFSEGTAAILDSFSLTGDSLLQVDLDPRAVSTAATLTVNGIATLGSGVSIRPDLQGISSNDFTHTFIDAGTLVFDGALDDSLIQDSPFLYNVELIANDDTRDTLDLQFDLKTTDELGLDLNQAAAYTAILDVFSSDDELGSALAEVTEETEFFQIYNMLLPQRTDAATRYLSSQNSAAFGALGNRIKTLSSSAERPFGLWAQEYFTAIDIDADTDVPGYNGSGLGFAAGLDSRLGFLDVAGLHLNYSSGDFEEKTGGNNPVTTSSFGIGLYAKESIGPMDFVVASQVSQVDFNSQREIEIDTLVYDQRADWGGTSAMTSASVSSQFEIGQFYARPQLSIDYFMLDQDNYTETGDDRLSLEIDAATTDRTSASAVLDIGARLPVGGRSPAFITPEFSIGYRGELSSSPYETVARFVSSEETFEILAQDSFSDAFLAGISLSTDSVMGSARFGYDVEIAEEGLIHFGGATLKLKF
ncbi:MAG: autotransporter domain-containing protein, partial [Pseudomonadota bacterium]